MVTGIFILVVPREQLQAPYDRDSQVCQVGEAPREQVKIEGLGPHPEGGVGGSEVDPASVLLMCLLIFTAAQF